MSTLLHNLSASEHVSRFILKLKLYRELAGLSQTEMAEALGVSHRTYQRIEAVETALDIEMVLKVCVQLKIEMSQWLNLVSPNQLGTVKILDPVAETTLTEDERALKAQFYKLSTSEEMSAFSAQPLFKQNPSVLFFAWNTRKMANDTAVSLSRLENSTKITMGYPNPQSIIDYIDWLNIHKPEFTVVDPVSLKMKTDATYYAYNYHAYKDGDVIIFSILRPHPLG